MKRIFATLLVCLNLTASAYTVTTLGHALSNSFSVDGVYYPFGALALSAPTTDTTVAALLFTYKPGALTTNKPISYYHRVSGNSFVNRTALVAYYDSFMSGTLSPGVVAGGDLAGTYPLPTIGAHKVTIAKLDTANVYPSIRLTIPAGGGGSSSYHIYSILGIDGTTTDTIQLLTTDVCSCYFIPLRVIVIITDTAWVGGALMAIPPNISLGWNNGPPGAGGTNLYNQFVTPFNNSPLFAPVLFADVAQPNSQAFTANHLYIPSATVFFINQSAGTDILTFHYDVFVEGYYSDLH